MSIVAFVWQKFYGLLQKSPTLEMHYHWLKGNLDTKLTLYFHGKF